MKFTFRIADIPLMKVTGEEPNKVTGLEEYSGI
jgi:hypothetical protein